MVECICINDKGKPTIIPPSKWVIKNEVYHITHIGTTLGSSVMCVTVKEITLGAEFYPYEGFRLDRFAFKEKDIPSLIELMKQCAELNNIDITELTNQPIIKTEEYEFQNNATG